MYCLQPIVAQEKKAASVHNSPKPFRKLIGAGGGEWRKIYKRVEVILLLCLYLVFGLREEFRERGEGRGERGEGRGER